MVRVAWEGSLEELVGEVTGLEFTRQEFTEEQERAAVESAVSSRVREVGGSGERGNATVLRGVGR
jgi:hypothetical protein